MDGSVRFLNITLGAENGYYQHFTYPGGESQVRIKPEYIEDVKKAEYIRVIARVHNAEDIMELALLKNALDELRPKQKIYLFLPYMPYSRADRRFTPGDCSGFQTFLTLLDAMYWTGIFTLDTHSAASSNAVEGDVSPDLFIQSSIVDFAEANNTDKIMVVFPDAGARKRYELPSVIQCNTASISVEVLHCDKERDPETGRIRGIRTPELKNDGTPILVVDDICDGGRTFDDLYRAIWEKLNPEPKVNTLRSLDKTCPEMALYVTHGIFSQGFGPLLGYSRIYTTDSFNSEDECESYPRKVNMYRCLPRMFEAFNTFLKDNDA